MVWLFLFFPLPLLWLLLQNVSLLIQKNHLGKAGGGGRFAADTDHLCTDQARYHEVGAAESPIMEATLERTEERDWELLGGGFNFRGSFGLDYFLMFSTGNDIKYQ